MSKAFGLEVPSIKIKPRVRVKAEVRQVENPKKQFEGLPIRLHSQYKGKQENHWGGPGFYVIFSIFENTETGKFWHNSNIDLDFIGPHNSAELALRGLLSWTYFKEHELERIA